MIPQWFRLSLLTRKTSNNRGYNLARSYSTFSSLYDVYSLTAYILLTLLDSRIHALTNFTYDPCLVESADMSEACQVHDTCPRDGHVHEAVKRRFTVLFSTFVYIVNDMLTFHNTFLLHLAFPFDVNLV